MIRKLLLLAVFALGLSVMGAQAEDEKKGKLKDKLGKLDKGKLFEKLDENSDSKLTKDEFKKGFDKLKEMLEKAGEKAKQAAEKLDSDKVFAKLDANSDGSVSKDEFEKFEPLAELRKKADK